MQIRCNVTSKAIPPYDSVVREDIVIDLRLLANPVTFFTMSNYYKLRSHEIL